MEKHGNFCARTWLIFADLVTICSGSNPASEAATMNYQLQLIHS